MRQNIPLSSLFNYSYSHAPIDSKTDLDSWWLFDIESMPTLFTAESLGKSLLLYYGDETPIYQDPYLFKMHLEKVCADSKYYFDYLYKINAVRDSISEKDALTDVDSNIFENTQDDRTFQKGQTTSDGTFQKGTINTTESQQSGNTHSVSAFNNTTPQVANTDSATASSSGTESHAVDTSHGTVAYGTDTENKEWAHNRTEKGRHKTESELLNEMFKNTDFNYNMSVIEYIADKILIGVW